MLYLQTYTQILKCAQSGCNSFINIRWCHDQHKDVGHFNLKFIDRPSTYHIKNYSIKKDFSYTKSN